MTTCSSSESFKNSPLNWFAAFISTTVDHLENDNETDFNDKVNGLKEFLSDEMDYFEFMTLNLTDKKDLDCCCKSIDQTELPLMMLDLDNNNFSGKIPSSLWNLSTLMEFSAANNHLEGSLLWRLGVLELCSSCGSIAQQQHAFREHSETTLAFDESNNFGFVWKLVSGSIPAELGDAVILQGVYLGHNQLSGTIPGSFGKLTGLVKLNLTGNVLFGSIPISFGNMKELTHSDLSYNMLSGELPSIMSGVQSLVGPYVQNNRLSGQVGEFFSNSMTWRIETMNLSHNCFDGNLSWSLGNLSYLTNLDLHQNQLTDEIPSDLGNLMQLEYFDVSDNTRMRQLGTNCEVKSTSRYALFNAWRLGGIAITGDKIRNRKSWSRWIQAASGSSGSSVTEVQSDQLIEATENSCRYSDAIGDNTKESSEATLEDIDHNSNSTFTEQNQIKMRFKFLI
ncbi:hypothetical protein KIW84_044490 [Lathyrus oleraceus]|uniref:Uncharacterized protein n=1 Tax=Pisum sativum TaxID=3888 RepID=A0A9D5AVW9_PEA|nr:hypothetical protein KIW84_044490 [Pisum sativum]